MRYHINKHGVPSVCNAKTGNCPLGGNDSHFDSQEDAQTAADKANEDKYGILPPNSLMSRMMGVLNDKHFEILNKLNDEGFPSYVVGGSVRDSLLNIETDDVDITTSATTAEIKEIFSESTLIDVGQNHGTVPILMDGEVIEITTFKHDEETVSSIEDDLSKRDYTINAIAYDVEKGIIDIVGGVEDAENRVLRAVGSPSERFEEDPLRIMRGIRFSSTLGFRIDEGTEDAMFKNKELLKGVSGERIQKELNSLLSGQDAHTALNKYSSIIAEVVPGIKPMIGFDQKNPHHIYDVYKHSAVVVKNADDDIAHKLAGLFHDAGKPSTFVYNEEKQRGQFFGHADESVIIADKALKELRYSNKIRKRVLNIIVDHEENLSTKPYKVKRNVYEKGPDRFFDMINFKRADDSAKNPDKMSTYADYDKIESIARDFLDNEPILSHKDLDIEVKDVVDLGYKGSQIKAVLNELCLLTISGHKNDRESQISYLKKHGDKFNI